MGRTKLKDDLRSVGTLDEKSEPGFGWIKMINRIDQKISKAESSQRKK